LTIGFSYYLFGLVLVARFLAVQAYILFVSALPGVSADDDVAAASSVSGFLFEVDWSSLQFGFQVLCIFFLLFFSVVVSRDSRDVFKFILPHDAHLVCAQ
jgi:hypothetical protein